MNLIISKDSLESKLKQINEIKNSNDIKFSHQNPESVILLIKDELCPNHYEARMNIDGVSELKTFITLMNVAHSCSQGKNDKEKMVS